MKKIKLSSNRFALVDDEDFEFLNQWKWSLQKNKNLYYAKRFERKSIIFEGDKYFSSKVISMHRLIMNVDDRTVVVDHIDGDGLNNQKSNLRACTQKENSFNRRGPGTGTSKFKGVSQRGMSNQWRASIKAENKVLFLGTFSTEIEAANAYNIAAKKYFGDFAKLNNVNSINPKRIRTFKIKNTSSKYRGVCLIKSTGKWQASIRIGNKLIYLGSFINEHLAAVAYNNAVKNYHGDSHPVNEII